MFLRLVTRDDFYALKKVISSRGIGFLLSKLKIRSSERIKSQWNNYQSSGSNWWDVLSVRKRWNEKISGDKNISWKEYLLEKYLKGKSDLSLLSVGCGAGDKEVFFAKRPEFKRVVGVDISEKSIIQAKAKAQSNGSPVEYLCADFARQKLNIGVFDVVLFYSSLHHFTNIEKLITQKVFPLLKPQGLVVMFEYTGPNRFQFTNEQIKAANNCLTMLPEVFRKRKDSTIKHIIYPPGLLRMWINDPSEAPHSEDILPVLRRCMAPLEEKPVGGAILHMLLKDIAHNFENNSRESSEWLKRIFLYEDDYYFNSGHSDFWFGVYQKLYQ